jgi:hypothetical protein
VEPKNTQRRPLINLKYIQGVANDKLFNFGESFLCPMRDGHWKKLTNDIEGNRGRYNGDFLSNFIRASTSNRSKLQNKPFKNFENYELFYKK